MKKWIAMLLALCLAMSLAACGAREQSGDTAPSDTEDTAADTTPADPGLPGTVIGISVPNDTDSFWLGSARFLKNILKEQGYSVTVLFAEDDIATQQRHMREMLLNEVDCIIVAAIDSIALLEQEAAAKEKGIPVIAYDRLLMNTDAVVGYVSYDYETMGAELAQHVVQQKQLDIPDAAGRPYTIELFMGSPEDHNAMLLHRGALSVLQPYIDSGALECSSGRLAFEDTCVQTGTLEAAQQACADRLEREYTEKKLDICFAASDIIASGCRAALKAAGQTGDKWPLITGQGGDLDSVKAVAKDQQLVTVYKDPEAMAQACADMVLQLLTGEAVQTDTVCSNQALDVPAVLMPYLLIHKDNYIKELVETKIYTDSELTLPTEEGETQPQTEPSNETNPSTEASHPTQ